MRFALKRYAEHIFCAAAALVAVNATFLSDVVEAGGFDRFGNDQSLLFDNSAVVVDVSGSYLFTGRDFESVNGQAERVPLLDNYFVGSGRLKFGITEKTACLAAATQPFGLAIDHGESWSQAHEVTEQGFTVNELSLTCSLRLPVSSGFVRAIGGGSHDVIDYEQKEVNRSVSGSQVATRLRFHSSTQSWRAGLAYELPTAGLVASVMYYAPLNFALSGHIENVPLGGGNLLPSIPIFGHASMPAALEVSLRSIIAPGWLVGLGVKWMNWSALDHVPLYAQVSSGPFPAGLQLVDLRTYFTDGWTVSLLVGHQLSSQLSVSARAAWDKGVSTGWTSQSDFWSLLTTVHYKMDQHTELRLGVNTVLLTSGEITNGAVKATFSNDLAIIPTIGVTFRY